MVHTVTMFLHRPPSPTPTASCPLCGHGDYLLLAVLTVLTRTAKACWWQQHQDEVTTTADKGNGIEMFALHVVMDEERWWQLVMLWRSIVVWDYLQNECRWPDTDEGHSCCARRLECRNGQGCLLKLAKYLWTPLEWWHKWERSQTSGVCHV